MTAWTVSGIVLRVEEKWTRLQGQLREGILVSLIDESMDSMPVTFKSDSEKASWSA
jgi:hypothetical protein